MLPDAIFLEIVSPARLIFSGQVYEVTVPGLSGQLGILPGHAPLLSELQIGEISYKLKGEATGISVFCSWGFVEVLPDKVSVLAEVAEKPEEIDVKRAQTAKERAEQRLQSKDPYIDFNRANLALQRSIIRLQIVEKGK